MIIGVIIFEANFHVQFDHAFLRGLGFDYATGGFFFKELFYLRFCVVIFTVNHNHIRVAVSFFVDKNEKNDTDHDAADHSKRNHSCGKNDADCDGPKEERDIKRFFDRGAETNDGKRADHAEREHDVRRYGEDHSGGDHRKCDQCHAKGGGIHHARIGLFVNEEDKHTNAKGKRKRYEHIEDADACNVFEKARFKNIVQIHNYQ